jgi:hypothetical protein
LRRKDILPARRGFYEAPPPGHVVYKAAPQSLYNAFQAIRTHDLGDQNPGGLPSEWLDDPAIKAIVVAAHSLGNVDNITRRDLVDAARRGKIVVGTSRTLIAATGQAYAASLFSSNRDVTELGGTDRMIVSARKLSKAVARAVVARALLEGLDQAKTQQLLDSYAVARKLL